MYTLTTDGRPLFAQRFDDSHAHSLRISATDVFVVCLSRCTSDCICFNGIIYILLS
jgi:hypothetical protein